MGSELKRSTSEISSAIHRYGPCRLQKYPVLSATVISKGDLLFLDSGTVKPAASFTWDTNIATTQAAFAAVFVGVAAEGSANGESAPVSVDTGSISVWEMDCASASFVSGGPVGPAKASGNALENQKLVTAVAASSIGRVHVSGTSVTRVMASFAGAYSTDGANVNNALG